MIPQPVSEQGVAAKNAVPAGREWPILSLVVLLFLVCCFAVSLTRAPWYDEGFVANPAFALMATGYPGVSALDDNGPFLPFPQRISMKGIREHIYMEMPVHTALLAAWCKVLGFSLFKARMLSILAGLVVLLSWYFAVGRLTADRMVAPATVALLAVDYAFVLRSSEVRMDALSAAFGFAGLAVYLRLRESSFSRAVLWSHVCVSASAFTHPNGGILAFAGLLFLTLYYDFRRIRFRHFLIALSPYLVGAACWGWYISRDVASFKAQFLLNSVQGNRLSVFNSPLSALKDEIVVRYLGVLGGLGDAGAKRLKLIVPFSYWAGVLGLLSIPELRRRKGYLALLFLAGIYFLVLAFTDGRRSQCYLVHIVPVFVAPMAATMVWLWRKGRTQRIAVAAWVLALCAIQLGGTFYQVRQDGYHKIYLPALAFIQQHATADQLIIGPGTLGIGLRYPANFIDDFRLGFLSRKAPEWIVVNDWYREWFLALGDKEPDAYQFVRNRLDQNYKPVFTRADYVVYQRR